VHPQVPTRITRCHNPFATSSPRRLWVSATAIASTSSMSNRPVCAITAPSRSNRAVALTPRTTASRRSDCSKEASASQDIDEA